MKTRFKKVVTAVLCVVMLVAMVSGCKKAADDKDEQGRTKISIGGYPSAEGEARDRFDENVKEYEKANPDVVVTPNEFKFDVQAYYTMAAGDQLPDLYFTNYTEVKPSIESDIVADLTDVLEKRGFEGKFNDALMDIISKDGKIYAFPYNTYMLGLGYNVELFEKAGLMEADGTPKQPKDWDEVVEFAKIIKEKTGKAGFMMPTATYTGGWLFTSLAWSFGTEFMKQDKDGKWIATFDSPEAAAALQFVKDCKWKHNILPNDTLIDGNKFSELIGTGNAGMYIVAGDYPRTLMSYDTDINKIGIMAMPAGPKKHVTLLGGSVYMMPRRVTEDQKDACLRWIERSYHYDLSDERKQTIRNDIDLKISNGELVGILSASPWSADSEVVKFNSEVIKEKANININHVRLYNEFVTNCPAEVHPEEPICAQELYATLDRCIQEVMTNKDADPAEVLKKANADFQKDYLDNFSM